MKFPINNTLSASLLLLLAACGGGGGSGSNNSYTISGSLSGLNIGNSLKLANNGSDLLTLSSSGDFSFNKKITSNYLVTIENQPYWQNCTINNASGTASSNINNVLVTCNEAQASVTTYAGSVISGSVNDTALNSSFNLPYSVANDATGNIYVADLSNNMIRKINPQGVVITLAGSTTAGSANGTGVGASFNMPAGVAVDGNNNVYVADAMNHMIRKITPEGVVTTFAGSTTAGSANGIGVGASFNQPQGVAIDSVGNIYVADTGNHLIRKISLTGEVTTLAGSGTPGSDNGLGTIASFNGPASLSVNADGIVYVIDNNKMIRQITPLGYVTAFAGSQNAGHSDGVGSSATFGGSGGLAIDRIGNVYFADIENHMIRKITPLGVVTTLAGSIVFGASNGTGLAATFKYPSGLSLDNSGNIFIADSNNNMIRKISPIN